VLEHRLRRVIDDLVPCGAAVLQRQVEGDEVHVRRQDARRQHAQRLIEQLLTGLVALHDDDGVTLLHDVLASFLGRGDEGKGAGKVAPYCRSSST